jgi:hypothetical protein
MCAKSSVWVELPPQLLPPSSPGQYRDATVTLWRKAHERHFRLKSSSCCVITARAALTYRTAQSDPRRGPNGTAARNGLYELFWKALRRAALPHGNSASLFNDLHFRLRAASP